LERFHKGRDARLRLRIVHGDTREGAASPQSSDVGGAHRFGGFVPILLQNYFRPQDITIKLGANERKFTALALL
jgi:hypothetical protein